MGINAGLGAYQVENALKVSEALEAYLNGDVEPAIALCGDNIVWRSVAEPEHAPFGGVYHGRKGVRDFFDRMFAAFHILEPRIEEIIPAGDEVLHILKLQAVKIDGSADGAAYVVGRWRFRHGLAEAYTDYFNVPASIQTSEHARANGVMPVTRDPSFAVYQNENAMAVLDILVAYRAGNLDPLFKRLHPDVAWRSLSEPHHAKFGGLFRGPDAVKTFFRRLGESLAMIEYRVIDVIPAGNEAISVAQCFVHVVGNPSRKASIQLVNIWTFEKGKVTAMTEYFNVPAYRAQLKLD